MRIDINGLSFAYREDHPVLKDIRMHAHPGEITAVIGPNAAGKSTLMKCIAGLLDARDSVTYNGRSISSLDCGIRDGICYLPQDISARAVLSVFETVLLGRLKTLTWRLRKRDLDIAMEALERIGIANLALNYLNELSGGQRQLVYIAQSIAGEPHILLLDELTSSLDLQHQLKILVLIRQYAREHNITVIIALHDLNLAARYSDRFVVMHAGIIHSTGRAGEVLTPEMLRNVYKVNAEVSIDRRGMTRVDPVGPIADNPAGVN